MIGSKPYRRPEPTAAELKATTKDVDEHSRYELDFRKSPNHIWLLDFNECEGITVGDTAESEKIDMLLKAFYFNDPYYPRPVSQHPANVELWRTFPVSYLECSAESR